MDAISLKVGIAMTQPVVIWSFGVLTVLAFSVLFAGAYFDHQGLLDFGKETVRAVIAADLGALTTFAGTRTPTGTTAQQEQRQAAGNDGH